MGENAKSGMLWGHLEVIRTSHFFYKFEVGNTAIEVGNSAIEVQNSASEVQNNGGIPDPEHSQVARSVLALCQWDILSKSGFDYANCQLLRSGTLPGHLTVFQT